MKKILFTVFVFLFMISNGHASNRINVTLSKCVDGDTAYFIVNNKEIKVRFLAIDTPESTNKIEAFGHEASTYTCALLTNANKIELEKEKNSEELDKYDRYLYWIFVDNQLLQNKIIQMGLGKVAYLYGDYEYTEMLQATQLQAKLEKKGIWQDTDYTTFIVISLIILLIIVIICIISKKERKKIVSKIKRLLKSEGKKQVKKYKKL